LDLNFDFEQFSVVTISILSGLNWVFQEDSGFVLVVLPAHQTTSVHD